LNSDSDFEGDYTNMKSLKELEGEELEANLHKLRAELEDLAAPTKYNQIMEPKLARDWKKAEQNHTLGYTGNSKKMQERREKEAPDRETAHTEA